jgi:hypothetical protein
MAIVIKPKRREVSGAPASEDLEVGEIAINTNDKAIFTKTVSGTVVKIANYAESDPSVTFPTGDLGDLSTSQDAFGQELDSNFDSLDTPNGTLTTQDLGALS